MKYYNLIKLNQYIKNFRLKFLGIYLLHILKKRYLAIHLDPVNACNLRCKMCYFTDADYVKKLKGILTKNDIEILAESFFKRAIKLQIGCGTEPTLYKDITHIIKLAKANKVPYISLTTNANKINEEELEQWAKNGLSEITISLHGVTKKTYENFMQKGNFNTFMQSLQYITKIKQLYPLKLRINYTFNEDNFEELTQFYDVFNNIDIDTLQLRPIVKIGNTEYNNFSLQKIIPIYNSVYQKLITESQKRNTTLLAHNPKQLKQRVSLNSVVKKYVYCYISPTSLYHSNFKWGAETYNQYAKRTQLTKSMLQDATAKKEKILQYADDKLNYDVLN